jgi:hypothetical protein
MWHNPLQAKALLMRNEESLARLATMAEKRPLRQDVDERQA